MDKEFIYNRISELQGNMSDRAVSKAMGMNENYIQNMKRQKTMPSLDTLASLCRVFRISLSAFFGPEKDDYSREEVDFYNNLRSKVNPDDYKVLSKAANKADEEDFHLLAEFLKRHL